MMKSKKGGKGSQSAGAQNTRKLLRCPTCGYATFIKARFTKHVKYHSMPFIKCDHCDFQTQYTWNLDRHLKNHTGVGSLVCPLCNFSCDMKQSLTSHVHNHHNVVPPEVMAMFKSPATSPTPKIKINKPVAKPEVKRSSSSLLLKKFYKCRLCNFNALSEEMLQKHVGSKHSKMPALSRNEQGSGLEKKPMPSLIPIPKSEGSSPTLTSLLTKSSHQNANHDLNSVISKNDFLRSLGLTPTGELPQVQVNVQIPKSRPILVPKRRTSFFDKLSKKLTTNSALAVTSTSAPSPSATSIISNSVRCQACRHRCKSSADLIAHLNFCPEGNQNRGEPEMGVGLTTKSKKVYKCPQKDCNFWATTASRFHVHIVGHYNTKPFECSQCYYRSNWRWDITKHIRLKTMRDPGHSKAKVLLTHKSGERNYRKYDRYLVPMDVSYRADAKLPDCSSVASRRPDVNFTDDGGVQGQGQGQRMPSLKRAPNTNSSASVSSFDENEEVGQWPESNPLPVFKQIITISPFDGNLGASSTSGRSFVEKRMHAGGQMLQNFDSLGRDITVTPIKGSEILKIPEFGFSQGIGFRAPERSSSPSMWKCKKCNFRHFEKSQVIAHINEAHAPKNGELMSLLNQNNLSMEFNLSENCENLPEIPESEEEEDYPFLQMNVHECIYCAASFNTKRELEAHTKIHGTETDPNTDSVAGLILPEEIHIKPRAQQGQLGSASIYKKYHCKECPYVTDSKGQFIYHKRFHIPSPEAIYSCDHCSYRVSHKHLLHQHSRVHGSDQIKSEVQDSSSECHPKVLMWKGGRPYSMFRCRLCPQIFSKLPELKEHEGGHQINEDEYACDALNLSLKPMPRRNSSERERGPVSGIPLLYLCQNCPARFLYEKELRIHHSFHEKTNDFGCGLCSYSARQEVPHLMSHMKVHSAEYQEKTAAMLQSKYKTAPPLKFECCAPKPFKIESVTISQNSNSAPNFEPSIPCRKCPAKFNTLASFVHHSNHHGQSTHFVCAICDYGADSAQNLTLHSILHSGSELTIEPEIGLSLSPKNMETEGNPEFQYPTVTKNGKVKCKRYKCVKCPSAFDKRDQYRVHIGLHGSSQRYKCSVCDYAVTYYANFIQHLKKHENQPNVRKEQLVATPLSKMRQGEESKVPPLVLKVPKTPIPCGSCPFKGNSPSELSSHAKHHGANEAERCVFCDFSSNEREDLKEHLALHFDLEAKLGNASKPKSNSRDSTSESNSELESDDDDYEAVVSRKKKFGFVPQKKLVI